MSDYKSRKVLVTGAGGFIGRELVRLLLAEGAEVTAFLRYNSHNVADYTALFENNADLKIIRGDIEDAAAMHQAVRGHEYVFHLAALVGIPYSYVHPGEVFNTNLLGTMNVLMAVKDHPDVKRLVVTSTSEVFGSAQYVPMDEKHPKHAQSPYAATKVGCDALAGSFHCSFKTPVVILRPFNTFGPWQSMRAVIPSIIVQALVKKKLKLGNTDTTRDFTYVSDTASGFLRAGMAGEAALGEEINLGTGVEVKISDIVRKVSALTGVALDVEPDQQRIRPTASEVTRLCSENSKAKRVLGWVPQYDFDAGLAKTLEWFRSNLTQYNPEEYSV
ncbi:MAG: SDR family NAD(P)-dependent oxidoreductase [Candidatus Hydrogenedentota bacterium]